MPTFPRIAPVLALASVLLPAAAWPQDSGRAAILKVLADSAEAWNRGDVGQFVAVGYENSPATVFVTQNGLITGYDAIARHYATAYGRRPGGLGRLSFGSLSVRPLTPDYALAYGTFRLVPASGGKPQSGIFDLVFHRSAAGWRIVSDHTS